VLICGTKLRPFRLAVPRFECDEHYGASFFSLSGSCQNSDVKYRHRRCKLCRLTALTKAKDDPEIIFATVFACSTSFSYAANIRALPASALPAIEPDD
jgi:hypothetical protein